MANLNNRINSPHTSSKKRNKREKVSKFHLRVIKEQLVSKSGKSKSKKKANYNMTILDEMLKSEHLVDCSGGSGSLQPTKIVLSKVSANNNNYKNAELLKAIEKSVSDATVKTKEYSPKRSKSNLSKICKRSKKVRGKKCNIDKQLLKQQIKKKNIENITQKKQGSGKVCSKNLNRRKSSEIVSNSLKNNSVNRNKSKTLKCNTKECSKSSKPMKTKDNDSSKLKSSSDVETPKSSTEHNKNVEHPKKSKIVVYYYPFQCDYCKEHYSSKFKLSEHIKVKHLNMKPYPCCHCRKRFGQQCNLQVHLIQKHYELSNSPEKFICDLCNMSFLIKENLCLHLRNHTKGVGFYKCAFCIEKFSNHFHLTEHEKRHLKTRKYKCSICKMVFPNRSKLASHVRTHKDIKDFVCQYCGKEFLRPCSIRRHVEICHSGFRIQCPICCKKLKGHLSEHLRTHENSKPHKCPDCSQRFTQSTQLTVHRRSHTGARPYLCRICDKKFTHSNAMLLHFRRHTGEKPFHCAMCPSQFSQLPHMKAHMKTIHGKTEAYKCEKCQQFFKLRKLLDTHSKTCTPGGKQLSPEERHELSIKAPEMDSLMKLSRMRFLIALLLTMVASKSKLKCLGFNKRLIDDLLIDSLEAMGHTPCRDSSLSPLKKLKTNIEILLSATIPKEQMKRFMEEKKSTEDLLELLTDDKTSCAKIL